MGGADASSAVLLERAAELALLDEAITATVAGAPRAILIEGPAGIGKTALVRAAREGAARAGLRVLAARGGELEREFSLGIERQLFEPLLVRASHAERAELLARPATAVGRLFGLDGTDSDPPADEYESHNALYWLCARLAGHSPIMLAIDDVHWSDATSLRFLGYLARRIDDLPILLALARRVDEPGVDEDLAGIAAEPLVQVVRPGPLSLDAVRELAGALFETGPQDGFVRACHQATGGIPLFTLQLLDEARARCLRPVDINADVVAKLAPERLSTLVLNRLRRLSPAAIKVAEQVALLGAQAEVRHVCVLTALGQGDVLVAGDELAAAGLLRSGQPLEFSHPVLRASVYESIAAGRRAGSHGRAARLLRSEKAAPARIAMHLLNAPAAADRWAVAIWALELADRLDQADYWLLRLMEEAQRRQSPSQFMLAASARADVSCRRGALADAEQDATTALELAQSHGRDYSVCVSAAALLMTLTEQGRLAEAEVVAAGAPDSRGAKCDLAIYVCCLGWLRIAQERPAEALAEFQTAGSLAREAGHDLPGFWAWRVGAATALLTLGRRAEAQIMACEQLQLVQPFGAPGPIGIALRTLGLIEHGEVQLGLLHEAIRELERSPALLERARSYLELGAAMRRAGRRMESRQPLRAALDLADRCGAVVVAQRAREELLAAGGRPRRSRIGSVEGLTASELRVARRAAGGRTNREIAQELFVTVKAVEKHLASAYRKLGIQGRGELPAILSQTEEF